jgi:hypothetical protein
MKFIDTVTKMSIPACTETIYFATWDSIILFNVVIVWPWNILPDKLHSYKLFRLMLWILVLNTPVFIVFETEGLRRV